MRIKEAESALNSAKQKIVLVDVYSTIMTIVVIKTVHAMVQSRGSGSRLPGLSPALSLPTTWASAVLSFEVSSGK